MTMTPTTLPTTVELTGAELLAVSELAQIRRTLAELEDRQKEIRGALLARMDSVGATAGVHGGAVVVTIVESTRPNVSAKKVQDEFPEVWAAIGTTTTFRSVRPNSPSIV